MGGGRESQSEEASGVHSSPLSTKAVARRGERMATWERHVGGGRQAYPGQCAMQGLLLTLQNVPL